MKQTGRVDLTTAMGNQIILKYNPDGGQPFHIIKPVTNPFAACDEQTSWVNQNIVTNPDDTWEVMCTKINTSITVTILDIAEQIKANCCRKITNQYHEIYYVFPPIPNQPMRDFPDARMVDAWCEENLIGVVGCDGVYTRICC